MSFIKRILLLHLISIFGLIFYIHENNSDHIIRITSSADWETIGVRSDDEITVHLKSQDVLIIDKSYVKERHKPYRFLIFIEGDVTIKGVGKDQDYGAISVFMNNKNASLTLVDMELSSNNNPALTSVGGNSLIIPRNTQSLCNGIVITNCNDDPFIITGGGHVVSDGGSFSALSFIHTKDNLHGNSKNILAGLMITNQTRVEAFGGPYCAAIGSGYEEDEIHEINSRITIAILNGAEVLAVGGDYAPGIGCGPNRSSKFRIVIIDSTVTAMGGTQGAGIGGGYGVNSGEIIAIRSNITAAGGDSLQDNYVRDGGSAIGGGGGGVGGFDPDSIWYLVPFDPPRIQRGIAELIVIVDCRLRLYTGKGANGGNDGVQMIGTTSPADNYGDIIIFNTILEEILERPNGELLPSRR